MFLTAYFTFCSQIPSIFVLNVSSFCVFSSFLCHKFLSIQLNRAAKDMEIHLLMVNTKQEGISSMGRDRMAGGGGGGGGGGAGMKNPQYSVFSNFVTRALLYWICSSLVMKFKN